MDLRQRFVLFTQGKTQEKHKVVYVEKVQYAEDKELQLNAVSCFVLHTTVKQNHKIIKRQTILSNKHLYGLSNGKISTAQTVSKGLDGEKLTLEVII